MAWKKYKELTVEQAETANGRYDLKDPWDYEYNPPFGEQQVYNCALTEEAMTRNMPPSLRDAFKNNHKRGRR